MPIQCQVSENYLKAQRVLKKSGFLLEDIVTLLNARTERVALKGKRFQCEKPASDKNVQKVENDITTLIHSEITKGKYTKSDLYKLDGYKEFMDRHCIEHHYIFQV